MRFTSNKFKLRYRCLVKGVDKKLSIEIIDISNYIDAISMEGCFTSMLYRW